MTRTLLHELVEAFSVGLGNVLLVCRQQGVRNTERCCILRFTKMKKVVAIMIPALSC
jgi:hypothetical protein